LNWRQDIAVTVEEVQLSRTPRIALPEIGTPAIDWVPGRTRAQATIKVRNGNTTENHGAEAITRALEPFVGSQMNQANMEYMAGALQQAMTNEPTQGYTVAQDSTPIQNMIWSTKDNTASYDTWVGNDVTDTLAAGSIAEYTLAWDVYTGQVTVTGSECGCGNNTNWQYGTGTMVDPRIARLRQNLMPVIIGTRFGTGHAKAQNEKKARELLHGLVGDRQFRRYLKHGFITLRGKSGLVYQIFPGGSMTRVWKKGKQIEKLCVVMADSSIPPSDSVVMRLLMLMDCEKSFRKVAHVWSPDTTRLRRVAG